MKQFVMMLFGYTELRLSQSLATARFLHFKKINSQDFNKALRSLVPSKSLLMTKLLRSNLVAAHIWGNVETIKILIALSMGGLSVGPLNTGCSTPCCRPGQQGG